MDFHTSLTCVKEFFSVTSVVSVIFKLSFSKKGFSPGWNCPSSWYTANGSSRAKTFCRHASVLSKFLEGYQTGLRSLHGERCLSTSRSLRDKAPSFHWLRQRLQVNWEDDAHSSKSVCKVCPGRITRHYERKEFQVASKNFLNLFSSGRSARSRNIWLTSAGLSTMQFWLPQMA